MPECRAVSLARVAGLTHPRAVPLLRQQLAGAAEPCLHFVRDQQRVVGLEQLVGGSQVARLGHDNTGLTLASTGGKIFMCGVCLVELRKHPSEQACTLRVYF
jgi:hypothetical protein